jgi:alpha-beta hydrolase superfamily lysophospholipase
MQGVANMLIRPKRAVYSSLELGARRFSIRNRRYVRKDIHILNDRNQRLRCSHYMPEETYTVRIPCIIICHGNCGNRLDAIDIVEMLLPHDISVLSLDFSGSGLSEGEYVSLGYFEHKDISSVVEYLWRTEKISAIGLWGRSMGAVAALLYAARDSGISLVIADSPFSSLRELCIDILKQYLVTVIQRLPRAISNFLITKLKKIVHEKAGFDIE